MKRVIQIICIALVCLFVTSQVQAGPKAEVSNNTFDFGYAPQNSKLTHKYWVHSTGDEDLQILKVVPGCGCTKAPLEKNTISSGDSTWLEIIFSSKKYSNKVTKRPQFFTNAGEAAERVSFTAHIYAPSEVTSPLVIAPQRVNLSTQVVKSDMHLASEKAETSQENPGVVQITNSSDKDLTISLVDGDMENFDVTLPQTIKAGETVTGTISLKSSSIDTSFSKSITLEVNDETKTRFTIPIEYNSKVVSQN